MSEKLPTIPVGMASHPAAMYLATLSPGSWRSTVSVLNRMAGMLGYADVWSCPWHQLRFNTVLTLRAALVARGFAPETVKRMRAALLGTLKMAVKLKLMEPSDLAAIEFERVRGTTEKRASKRELTRPELLRMMRACLAARDRKIGQRDLAILALMLGNGVRRAGVAGAKLKHYDRRTRTLQVKGKGNVFYAAALEPGVVLALEAWLTVRGEAAGPLFSAAGRRGRLGREASAPLTPEAIYHMVLRRAEQAGVQDVTPHTFRYTCATRLLKGGVAEVLVQRVLAHSHLATTQTYFCLDDGDVRSAAEGVPIPLPHEFVRGRLTADGGRLTVDRRQKDRAAPRPKPLVAAKDRTRSRTGRKLAMIRQAAASREKG